jgi:hypothetical protein
MGRNRGSDVKIEGTCGQQQANGLFCTSPPVYGGTRCRHHNGELSFEARRKKANTMALRKITNKAAKLTTSQRSIIKRVAGSTAFRNLPESEQLEVEAAFNNPELLSVRADVALLEARRAELAKRIENQDSQAYRYGLVDLKKELLKNTKQANDAKRKLSSGDCTQEEFDAAVRRQGDSFSALMKAIDDGAKHDESYDELVAFTNKVVALKQKEHARLSMLHQMMTAGEVETIMVSLAAVVFEHVKEPELIAKIAADFDRVRREMPVGGSNTGSYIAELAGGIAVVEEAEKRFGEPEFNDEQTDESQSGDSVVDGEVVDSESVDDVGESESTEPDQSPE